MGNSGVVVVPVDLSSMVDKVVAADGEDRRLPLRESEDGDMARGPSVKGGLVL